MKYPQQPEEISAFEAKTHLSELLRETERGHAYVIRRRGKPVARLLPIERAGDSDFRSLAAEFRELRSKVRGKVSVRELIREGRRA